MLSEKSRPVIEATLPIIAERIGHITPDFYERMFAARPDLMDGLFSRSSQLEGTNRRRLLGPSRSSLPTLWSTPIPTLTRCFPVWRISTRP